MKHSINQSGIAHRRGLDLSFIDPLKTPSSEAVIHVLMKRQPFSTLGKKYSHAILYIQLVHEYHCETSSAKALLLS